MRFAIIEGRRVEAEPTLHGLCPGCGAKVIARCGNYKVWHWAHASRQHCDKWWEPETEWHRLWKDRFPPNWQERPSLDAGTGEVHIADVRTPVGLVIEFQHSPIAPEEMRSREAFYDPMIWVVDGCRNDFDRFNFTNMRGRPNGDGIAPFVWYGRSQLFARWYTTKPVFIDFGGEHGFWRILRFDPRTKQGLAGLVDIGAFVEHVRSGTTDFSSAGGPASM